MENSRWWHVAIAGSTVLIIAVMFAVDISPARRIAAVITALVFAFGWLLVGRHAWRDRRAAFGFACFVALVTLVGTSFVPTFAFIQMITYPLVWVLAGRIRVALLFNLAVCGAVLGGFALSTLFEPREMAVNALIQLVSLGFSISFGLWISSISARSEERKLLLDELRATQSRLEGLSREAGATGERERLAREIHDTIAQSLTGLVMLAQRARRETDAVVLDSHLAMLEENARAALVDTRSLVAASAPVDFAHGGLGDALTRLADRFTRETGIEMSVAVETNGAALDRDSEVALLRCAQESLANVRKHSEATSARLDLAVVEGISILRVRDDGHGFDSGGFHSGFGISGMRRRLEIVGGTLEIDSSIGRGTRVTVMLPNTDASVPYSTTSSPITPEATTREAADA